MRPRVAAGDNQPGDRSCGRQAGIRIELAPRHNLGSVFAYEICYSLAGFGVVLFVGSSVSALLPLFTQEPVAKFVKNLAAMHPVLSKQRLALHAEFLQEPS